MSLRQQSTAQVQGARCCRLQRPAVVVVAQGWGRFGRQQSHTEGRARSRQERQERQQERFRRRQEANQERGRGET
jgi:membrane protein involved in colicin uptake